MSIIGDPNNFPVGTERVRGRTEQDLEKATDATIRGIQKGIEITEEIQSNHNGFNPADWVFPADAGSLEAPVDPADWLNRESWVKTRVEQGSNIAPSLVQVGNSPFWRTSNEPVEPWDCERWPNSPYCGGMNDPKAFVDAAMGLKMGGSFSLSSTGCETCVTYQPSFLGIPGPITRVCYRKDDEFCKIPVIKEAEEPPIYPPGQRQKIVPVPVAPPGKVRFLYCFNIASRKITVDSSMESRDYPFSEEGRERLRQAKLSAFQPFAMETIVNEFESYETIIEPGIIRCSLDLFSTVAFVPNYPRGVRLQDFLVLPWENTDLSYLPTVVNGSDGQGGWGGPSYLKLQRRDWAIRTPGYYNIAIQSTPYPPLVQSEIEIEGTPVTITVNEYVGDTSYVLFVDHDCSLFSDPSVTHQWVSDFYLNRFGQIAVFARRAYGDFGAIGFVDSMTHLDSIRIPATECFKLVQVVASEECPIPTRDPTPVVLEPDPMDCCDEVLEQLDLIKLSLGVDEFPVKAPSNLAIKNPPQIELSSHVDLWAWLARNLDGLIGQFPINVEIEDVDPTTKGNQKEEIELPNIAETLAEMFGLIYQSEIKTDLLSEMMLRLIPEVVAAKNAAIVGQSYGKANASYLGYRGALEHVEIPSNFNLAEIESLPEFLKESKGKLLVFKDKDKTTLQDTHDKLLFAAHIIKSVFYVSGNEKDRLLDAIEMMFSDEENNIAVNKQDWQDWLAKVNKKTHRENEPHAQKPQVDEIAVKEDDENGTV